MPSETLARETDVQTPAVSTLKKQVTDLVGGLLNNSETINALRETITALLEEERRRVDMLLGSQNAGSLVNSSDAIDQADTKLPQHRMSNLISKKGINPDTLAIFDDCMCSTIQGLNAYFHPDRFTKYNPLDVSVILKGIEITLQRLDKICTWYSGQSLGDGITDNETQLLVDDIMRYSKYCIRRRGRSFLKTIKDLSDIMVAIRRTYPNPDVQKLLIASELFHTHHLPIAADKCGISEDDLEKIGEVLQSNIDMTISYLVGEREEKPTCDCGAVINNLNIVEEQKNVREQAIEITTNSEGVSENDQQIRQKRIQLVREGIDSWDEYLNTQEPQ